MNDETLPRDTCLSSSGHRLRGSYRPRPRPGTLSGKLTAEREPQEAADTRSLERFIRLFPMWGRRTLYKWQMISHIFRLDVNVKTQQCAFFYITQIKCVLKRFRQSARHKGVWGHGSTASLVFKLGIRFRWVVSFTLRPLYPEGEISGSSIAYIKLFSHFVIFSNKEFSSHKKDQNFEVRDWWTVFVPIMLSICAPPTTWLH